LVVAKESVVQAKETVNAGEGNQLPSVTANADVTRQKNSGSGFSSPINTGTSRGRYSNSSSATINASYTVFDGGEKKGTTRQSRAEREAAQADYIVTSAELRYELRTSYIALWQAQEKIQISEEIYNIRKSSYELVKLHYESGSENIGALKLAEADLAQAQALVDAAKRDIKSAQVALCKALGYPEAKELQVDALSINPKTTAAQMKEPDLEELAKEHPSYAKSLAKENSSRAALTAAQSQDYPTVTISASGGSSSNDIPPKGNEGSVSAAVSYTIFNGFAREAGVAKARSALRSAQASTRSTYNTLYATLKSNFVAWQDALQTVDVQAKYLEAQKEREKISQSQYNVGRLDYNNWTIIEDALVQAKQNELNARANALKAEAAWEQAKGNPIEEENN
jgi:outer membrane protein